MKENFNNKYEKKEEKIYDDQIEGRNSVIELLESKKDINKIFVTKGEKHGSINKILAMARERNVIIVEKDKRQMEQMAQTPNYQGVIAIVPPFEYCEIEDILEDAKNKNEDPFVLILDGIEDPHNLGSIIRTAETAGIHGVIIPKRRSVHITPIVAKASAGAIEYMPVCKVTNIVNTIKRLKEEGLWIAAADMDGEVFYEQNLTGPIGLVIGSEGFGISRLVKQNCDFTVKMPMTGNVTSLNASVAGGILLYEIFRQRNRD